jgi:hypothetical protein
MESKTPAGAYFGKVMKAIAPNGGYQPPASMENLKRLDAILAKMRRAGISEDDIKFLGDFYQADAMHVWKLIEMKGGISGN